MWGTQVWWFSLHQSRPLVRLQASGLQIEVRRVAHAANGEEDRFAHQPLAAFQLHIDHALRQLLDSDDVLAQSENHPERPGMIDQRVDDLGVAEVEEPFAAVDHGHLYAQGRQHDSVFNPDHPRSHHDHRTRDLLQLEQLVGIENPRAVEGDMTWPGRLCAAGDEHIVRLDDARTLRGKHLHLVRRDEAGAAGQNVDAVCAATGPGQRPFHAA